MKLFDGSPSHGAKGEPERTSAWQPDGCVKRGEGERNGRGDGNGGRCQTAGMTWSQSDGRGNAELEPAIQYRAWGADDGLDTSSRRQQVQRRDGQSPKEIPLPPQISSHFTRRLAGDQMFTMPLQTL